MQETARRMVAEDIQPILAAHDPDKPLPKQALLEIFGLFAKQGLTSPRLPEEAGGTGMRMLDYGIMFEQIPAWLGLSIMAQEVTATRIYADIDPEQRERFLPDLFAGRKIAGTGTTEPDAGSNPREIRTRAERDGDDLVINGRKIWISNGSVADLVLITCIEGGSKESHGKLVRVVVERADSPFETREIETLGLRQGHLSELVFEDCRVPATNRLGTAPDAAKLLTLTWNGNRPLVGLLAVAMAQQALDKALEYADVREQFGRKIGATQLIQERLADIKTAITTSRLLCYHALQMIDRGERANETSAMAKRYAIAACTEAISSAMHIHGAMGISREVGLERLYRDVRMLPIPDGTNEILTLIQGREMTGQDAFRG
jgi:alkylation response protein AidB-like acyl-CoA dehydrogenase